MNRTTLGFGHFKTVSGHFFANCINSFHKTEDLTVILRGPTLFFNILIWLKTYFFASSLLLVFCNFVRKKKENLWLINGHFMTISGHFFANYIKIFHKTEIQTVILRCLVCLNPDWIKSNDIISVKIFFFSCLKMHHFRASLPKWVLTTPKKISSHIFKMAIFPKFFEAFMTYIIRLNRDKEIKLFPELSINKIFGDSFVRFISNRSLDQNI